jgi:ZIP family zinc transporter
VETGGVRGGGAVPVLSGGDVVLEALIWGLVAASALALGAALGVIRPWPDPVIGVVLAFGTGALISAVSFDLALEGLREARGLTPLAIGLAVGAILFFVGDTAVDRLAERRASTAGMAGPGTSLALGAFLDGLPENMVLGVGLSRGEGVSVALVAAIFISNIPESMGSASEMHKAGADGKRIVLGWVAVAVTTALTAPLGYLVADVLGREFIGAANGFAAGALLVMLATSMAPEAREKLGRPAGVATVLGFALAVALSTSS